MAEKVSYLTAQDGVSKPIGSVSSSSTIQMGAPVKGDRSKVKTAAELSKLYGGINYDQSAIEKVYQKATDSEYAAKNREYARTQGQFYNRLGTAQDAQVDASRRLRANAVMSGASRAMTGVEEFKMIQAAQQASTLDNTTLVQQQRALADQYAAAKTKSTRDAMTYADMQKAGLMSTGANMFASDTQYDVGLLGANSMISAANTAASAQGYVADQALAGTDMTSSRNLEGNKYVADKGFESTKYSSDSSSAASGKAAELGYQGQLAYANGMVGAANASAAGQITSAQIQGDAQIMSTYMSGISTVMINSPAGSDINGLLNGYNQWTSDPEGASQAYLAQYTGAGTAKPQASK